MAQSCHRTPKKWNKSILRSPQSCMHAFIHPSTTFKLLDRLLDNVEGWWFLRLWWLWGAYKILYNVTAQAKSKFVWCRIHPSIRSSSHPVSQSVIIPSTNPFSRKCLRMRYRVRLFTCAMRVDMSSQHLSLLSWTGLSYQTSLIHTSCYPLIQ